MSAGDLRLYRVVEHLLIDTKQYGLPSSLGDKVFFIIFERGGLEDPNNDPLGVFYEGGIKYYIWRAKHWVGVDYDLKNLLEKAQILRLQGRIKQEDLDLLFKITIYRAAGILDTNMMSSFTHYGVAAVKLCRSNLL